MILWQANKCCRKNYLAHAYLLDTSKRQLLDSEGSSVLSHTSRLSGAGGLKARMGFLLGKRSETLRAVASLLANSPFKPMPISQPISENQCGQLAASLNSYDDCKNPGNPMAQVLARICQGAILGTYF